MEVDVLLADIITNDLQLDSTKVVVYSQNYVPPKDQGIYVVIYSGQVSVLGNNVSFDPVTNEEVKTNISFVTLNVEITSKDRSAYIRKEEISMCVVSQYSLEKQYNHGIRFFRPKQIIDLSFIENTSALYRFRVPIVATQKKEIRKQVPYFEKLRSIETNIE